MTQTNLTEKWYFVSKLIENVDWIHKDNLQAEENYSLEYQGMILVLSAIVWGKNRKTIRYPKTWIDAFKLRWFPKWALNKWPPTIVKVKYDEILPMLSIKTEPSSIVMVKSDVQWNQDIADQDEKTT